MNNHGDDDAGDNDADGNDDGNDENDIATTAPKKQCEKLAKGGEKRYVPNRKRSENN